MISKSEKDYKSSEWDSKIGYSFTLPGSKPSLQTVQNNAHRNVLRFGSKQPYSCVNCRTITEMRFTIIRIVVFQVSVLGTDDTVQSCLLFILGVYVRVILKLSLATLCLSHRNAAMKFHMHFYVSRRKFAVLQESTSKCKPRVLINVVTLRESQHNDIT